MGNTNTMFINGRPVTFDREKNLLEVIRKAGIELPTFCYYSELSIYGACRMCLVEVENKGIVAACSEPPRAGYVVWTHTPRLQRQRRNTMELLLASHHRECTTCSKNGNCKLQEIAKKVGVDKIRFGGPEERVSIDDSSPAIIRDPNKCILCGDCVRVCEEVQGIGVIGFAYRGSRTQVTPAFNKPLREVDCVDCGQCVAHCPTGALQIKPELNQVWRAIYDPHKLVVGQIAPAVRVAFGEAFGLKPGEVTTGKIVAALKRIGFDLVFDTCFAADLTVMEESKEFDKRLENGGPLPLFTSCCPAWVKFVELHYPDYLGNLSSCRSPQQMFGSFAKRYLARETDKEVFVVSVMPCTAKKAEAKRPEFSYNGVPDVDAVISTWELIKMVQTAGIVFAELEEEPFDMPFGFATGAGLIFGVTGGVTEAVLRNLDADRASFIQARGMEGVKELQVEVGGREVKGAIVHGLKHARVLLEKLRKGEVKYDIVEVMACPGGCIGGAGQPCPPDSQTRADRGQGLYRTDRGMQLTRSKDNPIIMKVYQEWLKEPGSPLAHELLHTTYRPRKRIQLEGITFPTKEAREEGRVKEISVCVGTCCYVKGAYDIFREFYRELKERGLEKEITLKATFCLENCKESPNIKVGDKVIGGIKKEDVKLILESL